jgi:KDO2-lipid IV(A) lauroyltransferase
MKKISITRRFRYALETALVYSVYGFFSVLPLAVASNLGGGLMRRLGPRLGISRHAEKNIARAFPEKSEAERRSILLGMWDNLGRVAAEYPHLHDIWSEVELVGQEYLAAARETGKPSLFFAAHLGNWEINPISAKKNGLPIHLIYRKPNNPWVDGLLRRARDSSAAGHIAKGSEGAREIFSLLRRNQAIGFLMDQKLNEGISVPFFGIGAMTAPAIAQFAIKFGCPLYPSRVERLNGSKFRVTIYPPLVMNFSGNKDSDVYQILSAINARIEDWVRERPEQWLWLHRRWPDEKTDENF